MFSKSFAVCEIFLFIDHSDVLESYPPALVFVPVYASHALKSLQFTRKGLSNEKRHHNLRHLSSIPLIENSPVVTISLNGRRSKHLNSLKFASGLICIKNFSPPATSIFFYRDHQRAQLSASGSSQYESTGPVVSCCIM